MYVYVGKRYAEAGPADMQCSYATLSACANADLRTLSYESFQINNYVTGFFL
jgi:hypothetical protein